MPPALSRPLEECGEEQQEDVGEQRPGEVEGVRGGSVREDRVEERAEIVRGLTTPHCPLTTHKSQLITRIGSQMASSARRASPARSLSLAHPVEPEAPDVAVVAGVAAREPAVGAARAIDGAGTGNQPFEAPIGV